jgi:hypothetical protein
LSATSGAITFVHTRVSITGTESLMRILFMTDVTPGLRAASDVRAAFTVGRVRIAAIGQGAP